MMAKEALVRLISTMQVLDSIKHASWLWPCCVLLSVRQNDCHSDYAHLKQVTGLLDYPTAYIKLQTINRVKQ